MKRFIFTSILLFTGCAHSYSLQPITEKPEALNGIQLNTLVTKTCVLQAGFESSTPEEMLIRVKVINKSETPFDIDFSSFALVGSSETLKEPSLAAQDPEKHLKELKSLAELQESRTTMDTYQGIDALGTLKGEKSDRQIEAAKDEYREKQKDADASRKKALELRKRMETLEPILLKKTTVKSGASAEGTLILRAAFKGTGIVTLESTHSVCTGGLRFNLKK